MNIRDCLAGQVACGMFASQSEYMGIIKNTEDAYLELAFECYKFADAMIIARSGKTKETVNTDNQLPKVAI